MLRPVCVLEMPNCPLLAREEVLHLQTCGGIAARVRAEARCDLKPPIGDSAVPGTKPWPIPKALLPASLLLKTSAAQPQLKPQPGKFFTQAFIRPHSRLLSSLEINSGCLTLAALWRLGKPQ